MKGFVPDDQERTMFLAVKHGTICEESKTPKDGFKEIKITNPRTKEEITKYYKPYRAIEAYITKIEWRDTKEQFEQRYMSWRIHLNANGNAAVLELPFASRVGTRFMKVAENIDYTQPVEFRAWHDRKEDATAFFVGQNGKAVRQNYTKENPGDCPPPTQNFKGDWNFDEQLRFLWKRMKSVVIPEVEAAAGERGEIATLDNQPASIRDVKPQPTHDERNEEWHARMGDMSDEELARGSAF